ncbi:MAG: ferredoxin [Chloroflexi bacterium]|nr:MAG: ferredoxin [Chloroflexota bacterium]
MTVRIDFEPIGRRGECSPDQSLLDCARQLGVDLVNFCGGAGTCGRCKVQVIEGDVSEPTATERELFTTEELKTRYRLACRAIPLGDCKVRVPPESLTAPQRTQVEGLEIAVEPDPPVRAYPVQVPPPSLEEGDLHADVERLVEALAQQHQVDSCIVDIEALRDISPQLRDEGWHVSVAVRDKEIVAVRPLSHRMLGLAVDLGTTKIAGYLVDLESGQTLASQGVMNPQIAYGEDLVARMAFAKRTPSNAVRLQELVTEAINQLALELCAEADTEPSQIVEAVVVANTTMHHLLLKLPVDQLARAPYVPAVESALDLKARDVGLRIVPGGYVHLLPNIAGYVGADHVAMLLAIEIAQAEGIVLALDIGTNTEICLANDGRLTSLSCASGPAFEGAHIKHGMRAANGAIERLRLMDDRIEYQTIGGAPPVGLCGSGILDSLAQLYQAGVVDAKGRMGEHPRVRDNGGGREFVLVGEDEQEAGRPAITFTQKDVRELQLAKGAMLAGIQVLLEINGLSEAAIDRVIIAGAFGTYIDVVSAITIGMLPRLPLDCFQQVGNAAGMGAKLALISRSKRAKAQAIARRVDYVELATFPQFAKTFARAMCLG